MMDKPAHTQVLRAVILRRIITNATKAAMKTAKTTLTCSAWFNVAPAPVSRDMIVAPAIRVAGIAGRTATEQKIVAKTTARRGR
ncbi:hypothetical protein A6A22_11500 [Arthrobacter sp. OY3WO11]|nr:hypothetical protein A6A22_11500 [Arthrobacter sp. OY3WO11]